MILRGMGVAEEGKEQQLEREDSEGGVAILRRQLRRRRVSVVIQNTYKVRQQLEERVLLTLF